MGTCALCWGVEVATRQSTMRCSSVICFGGMRVRERSIRSSKSMIFPARRSFLSPPPGAVRSRAASGSSGHSIRKSNGERGGCATEVRSRPRIGPGGRSNDRASGGCLTSPENRKSSLSEFIPAGVKSLKSDLLDSSFFQIDTVGPCLSGDRASGRDRGNIRRIAG